MTDITELAQRMKTAAEKATPGEWWADEVKNEGCYGSGDDCVEGFTSYAIYGSDGQTLFDSLNSDAACICEEYDGEGHVAWDEAAQRNAEFIALANPANVLALVEALERKEEQRANWFQMAQKLGENLDTAEKRIAELESRSVKLSPELYTIGDLIRTQDNRITDQPMFVVFQKREIIGSDEHSPSRICWVWDGEEVSELRAKRLEAPISEQVLPLQDKDLQGVIDALEHPAGINAAGKQVVRHALVELQERRKADSEPVAPQPELAKVIYHFRDWNEGFPVERFKADYVISWMLANYPPAQPAKDREQVRSEHAEWSQATFGNVGPVGPLKHLSKEALEAAAEPGDLSEWADMQFLMWDAQRRAGITDAQITQAMIDKLAVNKQREWPEPKDGEPRLHIKSQPATQEVHDEK